MNGEQSYAILPSNTHPSATSCPVFHQHPLFSPPGSATGSWRGRAIGSLPVEACRAPLRECGRRSYAGNASLRSARARAEKPTTLFKEMAVRGPLATSPLLCSSVCSAQSAPSFLVKDDPYFPLCTLARRLTTGLLAMPSSGGMWACEHEAGRFSRHPFGRPQPEG